MSVKILKLIVWLMLVPCLSFGDELLTDATHMADAPKWLTKTKVDKVVDPIQSFLEWSIHRAEVNWYKDQHTFAAAHKMGPSLRAFYRSSDNSIHLGPRVDQSNFDQIFGHEIAHVILAQKHKDGVPRWFEEGLANYLAKNGTVNYLWLSRQPYPSDVRNLVHPLRGSQLDIRYSYIASQALAEMIASKCDLRNLLRLSVGRKMENYLENICQIKDLNETFKKWIKDHAIESKKPSAQ